MARFYTNFEDVIRALESIDIASSVYLEVFDTSPRVAITIGEKYFFRAGNYLSVTVIVIEGVKYTIVKVLASGGRKGLLDIFDLGSSRDYTREILENISRIVGQRFEVLTEVDYLERSKSGLLKIK